MSPFKSKQQAKWMYANKPEMAKEWAAKTPSIKALPRTMTRVNRREGMAKARSKKGK